ncbi:MULTISPECIES: hypothetical protein [Bradyrhizobium]|uniref:Uncharacterized protein n=1 Tax=Bradyrhizobium elkanii TaxID=29448 RepID=A0A8I2C3A3_BRAEL|nr:MULTISPECIES: hypothetical protein [Bradyrhizobium]MBP1291171.1 hypothetical protein [Bradyrhizobium elkanii]MCP1928513.1 hypothetical protein [Bradyrhizobium elkanii]MCS3580872.1 hypothetical protein [Bradyrhizobium elkanii]MCS3723748.1 hypothetical protein [Bradyrhizobium elkanii]MCS4008158.1 hypothetical protein [Bradyrhizobium elkanii USDA 61]
MAVAPWPMNGPPEKQGSIDPMEEYDLYINVKKPAIGIYVRKGAQLPDLADKGDWVFDGTSAQDLLPPRVIEGVKADGHAFRDMD